MRLLLKIIAYDNKDQNELLPKKFELEHILPQKTGNYDSNGYTEEGLKEIIKYIGNLTLIEKSINIAASNEFFGKKRKTYRNSSIAMTKDLSKFSNWTPESIINRTSNLIKQLMNIWSVWNNEYDEAAKNFQQKSRRSD